VGRDLLPNYEGIARRFEQRQRKRGVAEQLFARLTGLDMKMEQYRLGERFIDLIAKERGHEAVRRIWEGPENLPTMQEIREPQRWIARVLDGAPKPVPTGPAVLASIGSEGNAEHSSQQRNT
jgi:putative hydrolase